MKFIVFLLSLYLSLGLYAETDSVLQSTIAGMAARHHGKLALYATNLKTGKSISIDADTPVPTASVIKLPILIEAMTQVKAGRRRLSDKVNLQKEDIVQGSGVLQFFETPLVMTLKDALTFMIIESDNTATKLVIDQVGIRNVNDGIARMGLKQTFLYKKVYKPAVGQMPPDQKKFGLGKSTAREMAQIMESIVRCSLQDQLLCEDMLYML